MLKSLFSHICIHILCADGREKDVTKSCAKGPSRYTQRETVEKQKRERKAEKKMGLRERGRKYFNWNDA